MSTNLSLPKTSLLSSASLDSKSSPVQYLITLALFTFFAEMVSMVVLYFLQIPNYVTNSLLDGIIMLVLITPGLYLLQLRPILKNTDAERRQRELAEGLVQSTIVLNRSLELDQVLHTILEQIRKVFPFQGADIVLTDGDNLRVAAFIGFEDYPNSLPSMEKSYTTEDYPLLRQVYLSHQPLIIDHVTAYPDWQAKPGREWVRSFAAVPLIVGSEVIGNINLNSEQPGQFSEKAVQQLLAFAVPAALAIYNARLYQAESTARQFAETLSAAAQVLSQTPNLEQVVVVRQNIV